MLTQSGMLVDYRAYMRRRSYADSTSRRRQAEARAWMAWAADWRTATYRDVERYLDERRTSDAQIRVILGCLRAWYRWAVRTELTAHDPTMLVDGPRMHTRLPRPAPDEQIARALTRAEPELAAVLGLMAGAGLRCVEVARLRWDDVDLGAGTAVVMGKGSKERTVYLGAEVVRLLAALDGIAGPVFPSRKPPGVPRTASSVSQWVNAHLHHMGYRITAHQLRHRAATTALQVPGADLLAVRDMLGHASVATTQLYTKCVPGLAAAVARAVPMPHL